MSLFLNTREKRLIQAIEDNNLSYINHLLTSKKSLNINYKGRNNFTPLLLAASLSDREEIIKIILNAENVNVNLKTKDNETALHLAIPNYNLEIIQLLIENNVNLNEKDKFGKTAIVRIIEQIKRYTIPNEVLNDSIINFATASSVYSDDTITSISIDGYPEQNSGSDKNNEEKLLAKLKKRKSLKDESLFDEISLSSDFSWVDNDDSGSLDICENFIESLSISLKQMNISEVADQILKEENNNNNNNNNDDDEEDSILNGKYKNKPMNYPVHGDDRKYPNVNKNGIQDGNDNLVVDTNFRENNLGKGKLRKDDHIESAKTIANENEMEPPQLTEETTETKINTPTTTAVASTTGSVTLHNNLSVTNKTETSQLSDNESLISLESFLASKIYGTTEKDSFSEDEGEEEVEEEEEVTRISNRTNHLSLLSHPDQYDVSITNANHYKDFNGDNQLKVNENHRDNDHIHNHNHNYNYNYNHNHNNNGVDAEDNEVNHVGTKDNVDSNVRNFNDDVTPQVMRINDNEDLDSNEVNNKTIKDEMPPPNYDMSLKDCQQEIRDIRLSDDDDEEQEENNTSGNSNGSATASEFSYLPSEFKAKKQDQNGKDFCGKSNINLNYMDNNSFVESIIPYENISFDSIFSNRNASRSHSVSDKHRKRYSAITLSAYDRMRLSHTLSYDRSRRKMMSKTLINELSFSKRDDSESIDQSSYIEEDNQNTRRETKRQKAKKYLAMLELLLWNDADPNVQDFDGRTSLMIACIYKLRQVVPVLLRYGTSVNTKDYLGKTALMYSCEKQEDGIVKQLLDYHSNINLQDNNGLTALMLACKFDNEEIIRLLLENRPRINRQDKNGDTALTYASRYGCSKAVYLLMRYCANGNIKNKRGETALIIACRHVNEDIIHILINQPIDIDLQDRNGNTALIYLCQKKNEYTELVREILLKHNVNINIKNKAGNSALHIAVFNNHLEIVKLLLLNHADINIKNGEGNTVLMMASSSANREQMVQLLLKFSDYYVSQRNIIKVLHLRKKKRLRDEQLEELLLLNTHIDINAVNNEGDTALMIASRNGNPKIVNDLLQYHADCNLQNNRLETAIIKAIKSMSKCTDKEPIEKYQQIIKLLILNDADTHIKDYKKRDFVYYAKSNKSFMHSFSKYQKTSSPKHQLQYYRY